MNRGRSSVTTNSSFQTILVVRGIEIYPKGDVPLYFFRACHY